MKRALSVIAVAVAALALAACGGGGINASYVKGAVDQYNANYGPTSNLTVNACTKLSGPYQGMPVYQCGYTNGTQDCFAVNYVKPDAINYPDVTSVTC